jgi:nucleotide-binding universal stress UspA family protein
MDRRIVLAHDGSINADWVSRYAIQMAATLPGRQLLLVHILDGTFARSRIEARFAAIASECARHDIVCQPLIHEQSGDVFSSLLQVIPPGAQTFCLCGARVAPKDRGFLAGTISERLLRCRKFNVVAIRVVSPGLLGCPPALLFPLAGHPRGFQAAMPFLLMLAASVKKLHLLRVMVVNPFYFRYISTVTSQRKIAEGYEYLSQVATEIREQTSGFDWHFNRNVVVSDDWATEILIQAGKVNAAMILLGATDRGLPSLFFRGNRLEQILRDTACDVGIYRSV